MDEMFQAAELKVPLNQEFLPLVLSYVESSAKIFGLGESETMPLILATEEIFSFLMFNAKSADELALKCRYRGSYLELIAKFTAEMLPVESLNLTSKISADDDSALESMGLMIAARSVDKLHLDIDDEGNMLLYMIKNKMYKKLEPEPMPEITYGERFTAVDIDVERIEEFCKLALAKYHGTPAAELVEYPERLADMISRGDFDGCFVEDEKEQIAGALLWKSDGKALIGHGLYLFTQSEVAAAALIDGCTVRSVMLKPFLLFIKDATEDTKGMFLKVKSSAYLTMNPMDKVSGVYLCPRLVSYVRDYFKYLGIAKNIYEQMDDIDDISKLSPKSAFAADVDKENKAVTLSVLWLGQDAVQNLKNHVEVLQKEGFLNITFLLEMSKQSDAVMGEFLLQAGFTPDVIIPETAEGDILTWKKVIS